jgi:hypothetical protein
MFLLMPLLYFFFPIFIPFSSAAMALPLTLPLTTNVFHWQLKSNSTLLTILSVSVFLCLTFTLCIIAPFFHSGSTGMATNIYSLAPILDVQELGLGVWTKGLRKNCPRYFLFWCTHFSIAITLLNITTRLSTPLFPLPLTLLELLTIFPFLNSVAQYARLVIPLLSHPLFSWSRTRLVTLGPIHTFSHPSFHIAKA